MTARGAAACLLAILAIGCGTRRAPAPRAAARAPGRDSAAAAVTQRCQLADSAVEAAIATVARQADGDEYCEDRHYAVDDLDGDSLDDLALTFNVEPASSDADDESYLMVFLSSRRGRPPLLLEIDNVGRDYGERYPTDVSIDGQEIVVDFSVYLTDDPDCCPSGTATARFLVTPGGLVERVRAGPRQQRRVPSA
jgi:LppP/LprE lipoprotein